MPTKSLAELEAMVGDSRVTTEAFRLEAGKVEEFARAIAADDPLFRDATVAATRGYDRVPAPLTYSQVSRFPRHTPDDIEGTGFDLGFRPAYVLHGEQGYEYERPLFVGDVLEGTTTLTNVFQREGDRAGTMTVVHLETEYRDQHDDRVLTERTIMLETEEAVGDESAAADTAAPNGGTVTADSDGPSPTGVGCERVSSIDDLAVGDSGPTVVVGDLERRHFVRYAGASGDFNPIHYDEPYATAAGNERVFGQGMLTAGITSRVVTRWFDLRDVTRFDIRFRSRVFPGDTVVATGEIDEIDPDAGTVETTLKARTAAGKTLLTGSATARLSDRD